MHDAASREGFLYLMHPCLKLLIFSDADQRDTSMSSY